MEDITRRLQAWHRGDAAARDVVLEQVYEALHTMAVMRIGGASQDLTLRPTVVVHDALLRLLEQVPDFRDRAHFFALVTLKMRAVLVDHARARAARKRGGGAVNLTLSHADVIGDEQGSTRSLDVLALHQALEELAAFDGRAARAVEMAYFGGMANAETAVVLEVSIATVERDLRFAKAWLNRRLA